MPDPSNADTELGGLLRALSSAPSAELPPVAIGRFRVTRTLGSGGMGVVYEAIDPTLDRRVAIKLLRPERSGDDADAAAARLLREAQALARLSHPNVVTIYEAGRDGDRVHLAMELVVGTTVRQWLAAAPRTAAQVLGVYRQAARGLGAAHAAGLVHRDVKPENILVGDDGRVRVTDFGLVAALELSHPPAEAPREVLAVTLTRTGAVMGTPPYMPPEAHRAQDVDARSDQWSLAVAIWEGLGGARPHDATTYPELVDQICSSTLAPPPTALPERTRAALERALAVDPAARWPSVDALVDALGEPPPRRNVALAVGAGFAAVGALSFGVIWWASRGGSPRHAVTDAAVSIGAVVPPVLNPIAITDLGGCAENPIYLDADTVVFDRSFEGLQDVYAVSPRGGEARPLTGPPNYHWHTRPGPGDGELTFLRKDREADQLHVTVRAADGVLRDLPFPSELDPRGGVIPVGDRFYYARSDGELGAVIGGADSAYVTLPKGWQVNILTLSPDARWIAIDTARTAGTCFVDLAADTPSPDCRPVPGAIANTAFTLDASAYFRADSTGVARYDRVTGARTLVAPGVYVSAGLAVSPDGGSLVYSDCTKRMRLLELRDGKPFELTAGRLSSPYVGPGDRLAYRWRARGEQTLVVREPDGTTRTVTDPALGLVTEPAWDATGSRLAFRVVGEGIAIVDLASLAVTRITDDAGDQRAVFLADGRLVFNRFDDQRPQVWILDPAGGEPRLALDEVRYVWDVNRVTGEVLLADAKRQHPSWWHPDTGVERFLEGLEPLELDSHGFDDEQVALDGSALYLARAAQLWRLDLRQPGPATLFHDLGPDTDGLGRPAPLSDGRVILSAVFYGGELFRVDLPDPTGP